MSDQKSESHAMNAKLCRLVQANPCMYDRSSPNYLKKDYVERAWAKIAKEVNDSIGSCKERWRNIRTAFARSVNIYKTPAGPNRHKRYYLHDELQFLTKHITPGLPSLPIRILTPTELEENAENSQISIEENFDKCSFQINLDSSSSPPAVDVEDERTFTPEPDYTELPASPVSKKRKVPDSDETVKDLRNSAERNVDPDMEFLKSLLPEMKAMNARQKILFKGKIFRTLEEVFDDTKDFPNKTEHIGVGTTSPVVAAKKITNNTSNLHSSQVPVMTLIQNDAYVKTEPISLDIND